jgi:hypothetical protein
MVSACMLNEIGQKDKELIVARYIFQVPFQTSIYLQPLTSPWTHGCLHIIIEYD